MLQALANSFLKLEHFTKKITVENIHLFLFKNLITVVALFLAPGAVSLKWMLKKMGFEKSFLFLNCLIGLILFAHTKQST